MSDTLWEKAYGDVCVAVSVSTGPEDDTSISRLRAQFYRTENGSGGSVGGFTVEECAHIVKHLSRWIKEVYAAEMQG